MRQRTLNGLEFRVGAGGTLEVGGSHPNVSPSMYIIISQPGASEDMLVYSIWGEPSTTPDHHFSSYTTV